MYILYMISVSFLRLPSSVQRLVTDGLGEEISAAFTRIGQAKTDTSIEPAEIRFLEGDIMRASALRGRLTGESATA